MPATFAGVVSGTFLVVAIVFFAYDWCVKRRNKELVTTAVQSHKVVASLFPGEMKNKVLARQSVRVQGMTHKPGVDRSICGPGKKVSPLAKEYENSTVFFGDLAGFTKWSSSRSPEQVFELLEHLYSTFDKIAKKRDIFKVETVSTSTCYIGLSTEIAWTREPNPCTCDLFGYLDWRLLCGCYWNTGTSERSCYSDDSLCQ